MKDKSDPIDLEQSLRGEINFEEVSEDQRLRWFRRKGKGITTSTADKKETAEGLWTMCPSCKFTSSTQELKENLFVCPSCNYHHRIGSDEYFDILFDDKHFERLFDNILSKDYLGFVDLKPYNKRLEETKLKTGLKDSMAVATGVIDQKRIVIACMDFEFIGGSLGSVMGEKIVRAAHYAMQQRIPLLIIGKSGGARMMESAFSLMQLPKTLSAIAQMGEQKVPYLVLSTDPSFGGVTASFGSVGDIIVAEPNALIGFAGPRVIKETIKKDLPPGFQRSEFLLEHGFLDIIVERKDLKKTLSDLLTYFSHIDKLK